MQTTQTQSETPRTMKTEFSASALAGIIEHAPAVLPAVFQCSCSTRFIAAVLTSRLARLGYVCQVDEETHAIHARHKDA